PHAPGLPHWIWRCCNRRHRQDHGAVAPCGKEGIDSRGHITESNFKRTDQPPGIRLRKKIQERILNGEFVELFSLLSHAALTSLKAKPAERQKKDKKVSVGCNFRNWLTTFSTYMGVIVATFPDRGWHLTNYLLIILKAKAMAGEVATLAYNEAFRERATEDDTV
ncbi:Hypothetical predicted protein, partial [Podarcis lilfordi]